LHRKLRLRHRLWFLPGFLALNACQAFQDGMSVCLNDTNGHEELMRGCRGAEEACWKVLALHGWLKRAPATGTAQDERRFRLKWASRG
jgi:hypothetical protein